MNKGILTLLLFGLLSLLCLPEADAQHKKRRGKKPKIHRFNAGLVLGLSFTQMDGDQFVGFDKRGIMGGLKGSMYLNKYTDLVVQLLYSQKGSRFETLSSLSYRGGKDRAIHLDYMEVPVMMNFKLYDPHRIGHGYLLEVGFSYARMVNYEIQEQENVDPLKVAYSSLTSDFNRDEWNVVAGLGYAINRHLSLGIRATMQVNLVYDNPFLKNKEDTGQLSAVPQIFTKPEEQIPHLRNYLFTINAVYNIF